MTDISDKKQTGQLGRGMGFLSVINQTSRTPGFLANANTPQDLPIYPHDQGKCCSIVCVIFDLYM